MTFDRRAHWEKIYGDRKPDEVSWFQEIPELSLELIRRSGIPKTGKLIDVGGGASRLVDHLLDTDFACVSVLDISARALSLAQDRLGSRAKKATWIEADVTAFVPAETYDVWHDRAVFHFLTEESDRMNYVECAVKSIKAGGYLILAAFAADGPEICSGLPVRRADENLLRESFGEDFVVQKVRRESHLTPWKSRQNFVYYLLKKRGIRSKSKK